MISGLNQKILISAILALILFDGCGKPKNLVERNGVWYEVNSQEPYTGDYTLTKSAEVNGEEKKWRAEEGYIRDGKFDGDFTFIGLDGSKATSTFKNGVLNGIYKEYSNSGQLIEESSYTNGKKNGKNQAFWANGQKKYDCEYVNGTIKSSCIEYDENGNINKKSEIIGKNLIRIQEMTGIQSFSITDESTINKQILHSVHYLTPQCKFSETFYDTKSGKIDVKMEVSPAFAQEGPHITSTYYNPNDGIINIEIEEPGDCITEPPKSRQEAQKLEDAKRAYNETH